MTKQLQEEWLFVDEITNLCKRTKTLGLRVAEHQKINTSDLTRRSIQMDTLVVMFEWASLHARLNERIVARPRRCNTTFYALATHAIMGIGAVVCIFSVTFTLGVRMIPNHLTQEGDKNIGLFA